MRHARFLSRMENGTRPSTRRGTWLLLIRFGSANGADFLLFLFFRGEVYFSFHLRFYTALLVERRK